jgi:DNA polymerase-4
VEREILHVNTDDFYASLLRLRDPALRGRPVVVAGPAPRGMVFSASYEARRDGVHRGMTVSAARRLSAGGIFCPPDWGLFRRASTAIFRILRRFSPLVEQSGLDEGYIDYTGCGRLFGHVLDAGTRIKNEIIRETGLQVSLGVASSKLVSHVASRSAKRAHLVDVYPGQERPFLAPVPIERFPPVGERRAVMLRELGIARVGDVLLFPEEIFSTCFGSWGRLLYCGAMGEDTAAVRSRPAPDERFAVEELLEPDRVDRGLLESVLYRLAEQLGERLRAERLQAGSLALEIRYADGIRAAGTGRVGVEKSGASEHPHGAEKSGDTGDAGGTARPAAPTSNDLRLFEAARRTFVRLFTRRVRVRSMLLSARRLEPEPVQLEIFIDPDAARAERMRRLHGALDRLRSSFPRGVAPAFGRAMNGRSVTRQ